MTSVNAVLLAFLVLWYPGAMALAKPMAAEAPSEIAGRYGQLPLSFEVNAGQSDPRARFISRGRGYTIFLTPQEAVIGLLKEGDKGEAGQRVVVRMALLHASKAPTMVGMEPLPGRSNYFVGSDRAKWLTHIPHYAKVKYDDVYPGIDLAYYGAQQRLEYDFEVAPGSDPRAIALDFQGVERLSIDQQGDLILHTATGELRQLRPVIYQEIEGKRELVSGRYELRGPRHVGFLIGQYDASKPLVIDPVLSYSTYLGGSGNDEGASVAVDSNGNAYLTGRTFSTNFPTQAPFDPAANGYADAFVTKLSASGTTLIYSTYLGGNGDDAGNGVAVDSSGSAYVTGTTVAWNFPVVNAYQPTRGTGYGASDAFVTKLAPAGDALVYSTYLGSSSGYDYRGNPNFGGVDQGIGIAVDSSGSAYVTGWTSSARTNGGVAFPHTTGAIDYGCFGNANSGTDGFVTKFSPAGNTLAYSGTLGACTHSSALFGIAVDSSGSAYVTGYTRATNYPVVNPFQSTKAGSAGSYDAVVTKVSPAGNALVYSTYLGGVGVNDIGRAIAVDSVGSAYVAGYTNSMDFPVTSSAWDTTCGTDGTCNSALLDAFVTKFAPAGNTLVYSTYLGAEGNDDAYGIAVDSQGAAIVVGSTASLAFPIVTAFQSGLSGSTDAYVTKVGPIGNTLPYSSYLGGGAADAGVGVAVDSTGNAYIVGRTSSGDFPTQNPYQLVYAGGGDAFVTKVSGPEVTAMVQIEPETVNKDSSGVPINVFISVAGPHVAEDIQIGDGFSVDMAFPTPVPPTCTTPVLPHTAGTEIFTGNNQLNVKFDRRTVEDCVNVGIDIVLTVNGKFTDQHTFSGYDTIRVIE